MCLPPAPAVDVPLASLLGPGHAMLRVEGVAGRQDRGRQQQAGEGGPVHKFHQDCGGEAAGEQAGAAVCLRLGQETDDRQAGRL